MNASQQAKAKDFKKGITDGRKQREIQVWKSIKLTENLLLFWYILLVYNEKLYYHIDMTY